MGKWNHSRNLLLNLPLNWKFSLIVLVPLLLMGIATTLTVEKSLSRYFHQKLLDDTYSIGNTLAAGATYHLLENDRKGVVDLLDSAVNMEKELAYIYVSGPDQKLIARTFSQNAPATIRKTLATGGPAESDPPGFPLTAGEIQEVTIPLRGGKLGEIHLGFTESAFREQVSQAWNKVILVTLFISVPGLAALLFLVRLITRPLANLARAAERIGQGELELELATGRDEIGQLALAFNRMAGELRDNQRRQDEVENKLRRSENLYRTLVDNIDLGITMISKDFEVLLANTGQGRLLNTDPENLIGKKCYEVFEKRHEVCRHCPGAKAMQSGRPEEAETWGTLSDGTQILALIRAFPVRDEKKEIIGFIEVVSDISTRRQMEGEIQRVKNIETIGQLAGGLAHDFNNLLTALIGNIALAKTGIPADNLARKRLEAAENACEQARRLTNQLLTFAKGGTPIKKNTLLPELLNEACHFALSGTNLRYILDAPDNLWSVEIDPSQMNQVINNLLVNAKDAMRENPAGKIFLVAENAALDESTNLPLPAGRYVKISVADEGGGISSADLDKIFHPYFTTKTMGNSRGTGLGLTICHSIVHKHGGHITVSSEINRGTTITLYLPAAEKNQPFRAPMAPQEDQTSGREPELRILLLEDEDEVAHIATGYLVSLRHHCDVAKTGREALKMTVKAVEEGQPYDLLILDLTIRGGPGGEEMLKQLRQLLPQVPAIVSSGYTTDPIMVEYLQHGFQATLPKPFDLNALRGAIAEATRTT